MVDVMILPVAVMTADAGPVAVEVDIADDGAIVFRGTDEPIDALSLVVLLGVDDDPGAVQIDGLELCAARR